MSLNCLAQEQLQVCQALVEECLRFGIKHVFIGPGSRSTPLTLAIAQRSEQAGGATLNSHVVVEERSLGFMALGAAKATGVPSLIVTTSGSATLNLLPAVSEAYYAAVPLLIMTADRPSSLHGVGANQSMSQDAIYTPFLRWFFKFPDSLSLNNLGFYLSQLDQALYKSTGQIAGPVHLNMPFQEPLYDTEALNQDHLMKQKQFGLTASAALKMWAQGKQVFCQFAAPKLAASQIQIDAWTNFIKDKKRPLFVLGKIAKSQQAPLFSWLEKLPSCPVCVELESGAYDVKNRLNHASFFLNNLASDLYPDALIHIGDRITNKAVENMMRHSALPTLHLNYHPQRSNVGHANQLELVLDFNDLSNLSYKPPQGHSDTWLSALKQLADKASLQCNLDASDPSSELAFVKTCLESLSKQCCLYVGNSLPIRHVNVLLTYERSTQHMFANRGLSGIEGTTATAVGYASASHQATVLLTGDLSCLYDLFSLWHSACQKPPLLIIVLNNSGGAIFSKLPVAKNNPYLSQYFNATHNLSFEGLCRHFNIDYVKCEQEKQLSDCLKSWNKRSLMFVECVC